MKKEFKNHTIEKTVITAAVTGVTVAATLQGTQWGKQLANSAINFTDNPEKMKNAADFIGTVVGGAVAFGASNIAINSLSFRDKLSQECEIAEEKHISR